MNGVPSNALWRIPEDPGLRELWSSGVAEFVDGRPLVRALIFVTHPDDSALGVGGTVVLLGAFAAEVTLCLVTAGEQRVGADRLRMFRDEIAFYQSLVDGNASRIRGIYLPRLLLEIGKSEDCTAASAADYISVGETGSPTTGLSACDLKQVQVLATDTKVINRFVDARSVPFYNSIIRLIRSCRPGLVCVQCRDRHPDHCEVNRAVHFAAWRAGRPSQLQFGHPWHCPSQFRLYEYAVTQPLSALTLVRLPEDAWHAKIEAFAKHESEWMNDPGYFATMDRMTRHYGNQLGSPEQQIRALVPGFSGGLTGLVQFVRGEWARSQENRVDFWADKLHSANQMVTRAEGFRQVAPSDGRKSA